MFYEASQAIINNHKTDYWLVGLDEPPTWIPSAWTFVNLSIIVRYLGIPIGLGLSLIAMWDWCLA